MSIVLPGDGKISSFSVSGMHVLVHVTEPESLRA
jgi:hypothetical protein